MKRIPTHRNSIHLAPMHKSGGLVRMHHVCVIAGWQPLAAAQRALVARFVMAKVENAYVHTTILQHSHRIY
jgi:hypothetical protein